MYGSYNYWNREDTLAEKELYDDEHIKEREEREKAQKEREKLKVKLEREEVIGIPIREEQKPKEEKMEFVTIKCKNAKIKNLKITNYFNITINNK